MPLREIKTIFSIDGQQKYTEAIKSINKQQQMLNSEMKTAMAQSELVGNKQDALKAKMQGLTGQIDLQRQKVDESRHAMEQAEQKYGKAADTTNELRQEYLKCERDLAKMESELKDTTKELYNQESAMKKAGDAAVKAGDHMKAAGAAMKTFGRNMTNYVTLPIVAAGGASVKAAMEYESAFTGVLKTVEGTPEQLQEISDGIRDMAKEVPTAATDIAKVAEAAGQLGIQTDNVLGFTKVMIDLGEATNLTSTEGAEQLARFANIMQMSQGDFDKLGSSIVALGNDSATTEAEIVEMGMRLAGAGKQAGMSEAEIMGFAAALSSLGIESEMGGSAMSKLVVRMQLAASKGTEADKVLKKTGKTVGELEMLADSDSKAFKKMAHDLGLTTEQFKDYMDASKSLAAYSKVTGKSAEEFTKAFGEDATGTLITFIDKLGGIKEGGGDVISVLEDMDISEVRLRDTILRTAGAGDYLRKSVDLSSDAWEKNNALTEEANRRYGTTESKLKMARNRINDAAITIGNQLLPVLADLAEDVAKAAEAFAKMDPKMQKTVMIALAVAAAVGPVTRTIGIFTQSAGIATKAIGTFIKKLAEKKAAEVAATAVTNGMTASTTALSASLGPVILIMAAVAAAAVVLYLAYREATRTTREFGEAGEKIAEEMGNWKDDVNEAKSALDGFSMSTIVSEEDLQSWDQGIKDCQGKIVGIAKLAAEETRAYTDKEKEEITALIDMIDVYTGKKIEAYEQQQQVVEAMAVREKEVTLQEANEMTKGAEEAYNQTLDIAEAAYKDKYGLAEKTYGHLGELDKTAYQAMLDEADKQYAAQIASAEKIYGDTLTVITDKYAEKAMADDVDLQRVMDINAELEEVERTHSANMEAIMADYNSKENKTADDSLKLKDDQLRETTRYEQEQRALMEELMKTYKDLDAEQLGSLLAMVANQELYGGELEKDTQILVDGILENFESMPKKAKEEMAKTIEGMLDGLEEKDQDLFTKAASIAQGVINRLKTIFQIASPSKVTRKIGSQAAEGVELGLDDMKKKVEDKAAGIADSVIDETKRMNDAAYLQQKLMASGLESAINVKVPELTPEKTAAMAEAQKRMIHSGKITVEGVNNKGELQGVTEIILDQLRLELMLAGG